MSKYIFLGGGGFALELYEYMIHDGCEVLGYYALEESEELKNILPWLGNTDEVKDEDLDKEAEYIVAVRLIKYRLNFPILEKSSKIKGIHRLSVKIIYSVACAVFLTAWSIRSACSSN